MKIRSDFVTNSSSSSFILAAKDEKQLKAKITLEVDFNDLCSAVISNEQDLDEYLQDSYGNGDDYTKEMKGKILPVLQAGKKVFNISVSSEDFDNPISQYIHSDPSILAKMLAGTEIQIISQEY